MRSSARESRPVSRSWIWRATQSAFCWAKTGASNPTQQRPTSTSRVIVRLCESLHKEVKFRSNSDKLVSEIAMTLLLARLLVAAVTVTIAAGCAARTKPQTAADLRRASDLVRQGCYDCLLEARTEYERGPVSPA